MKRLFENIRRLYLFDPPSYILPSEKLVSKDDFEFEKQLTSSLSNEAQGPIFVVAPFGAGKTAHLRQFICDFGRKYSFVYRSFFSVSNLNEAYLTLLPVMDRLLSSLVFILLVWLFVYLSGISLAALTAP